LFDPEFLSFVPEQSANVMNRRREIDLAMENQHAMISHNFFHLSHLSGNLEMPGFKD